MPPGVSSGIQRKRRKGKKGSSSPNPPAAPSAATRTSSPTPTRSTSPGLIPTSSTTGPNPASSSSTASPPTLILTGDKRRGLYECDYCRSDISQVPRIRCAVCPDFDLCLDCFATTDPSAAGTVRAAAAAAASALAVCSESEKDEQFGGRRRDGTGAVSPVPPGLSVAAANHDHTHGYRVADSTRFPVFPTVRGVVPLSSLEEGSRGGGNEETKKGGGEDDEKKKGGKTSEMEGGESNEKKGGGTGEDMDLDNASDEGKVKKAEDAAEDGKAEDGKGASSGPFSKEDGADSTTVKGEGKSEPRQATDEIMVCTDDPKNLWTAEEDLRLLDAVQTLGLGNWADISEAVSAGGGGGPGASNKSARRCMERYCDDFLGRYGRILPKWTLVEADSDDEDIITPTGTGDGNDDAMSTLSAESDSTGGGGGGGTGRRSKRKDRGGLLLHSQSSKLSAASSKSGGASSVFGGRNRKRLKVVPTASLPGYDEVWPDPYVPPLPGVKVGDDVGRDHAYRAEQSFVKTSASASTKDEADALRKEWMEKRLNQPQGPKVLPPRLEDIRTLPGSELAGFMPRRGDFDMEWDNDAEAILADMEFSPTDHLQDRQLKLQIIEIYNAKLDERERRKQFLIERNLLDYRKNQENDLLLPRDELDLVHRMRLFARFHSSAEHDQFVKDLLKAKKLRKEIAQLQMYRRMGITSLAEAERYELDKSRREHHKVARLQKEMEEEQAEATAARAAAEGSSSALGTSGGGASGGGGGAGSSSSVPASSALWKQYKSSDRKSRRSVNRTGSGLSETDPGGQDSTDATKKGGEGKGVQSPTKPQDAQQEGDDIEKEGTASQHSNEGDDEFDIKDAPGSNLLSAKEVELCKKIRLKPRDYLDVKKALIKESLTNGILDKEGSGSSRRSIVKIDVEKREDVIDFIVRAGWISARPRRALNGSPPPGSDTTENST